MFMLSKEVTLKEREGRWVFLGYLLRKMNARANLGSDYFMGRAEVM